MSRSAVVARDEPLGPLGVVAPPEILVECDAFAGSLAMLFQCVRERKVDLLGVPLGPVCEAYFRYLIESADQDLESAAVALAALAYLLERKAWLLLPRDEEPEPDGDELLEAVEPYVSEFMPAIEALRLKHEERESTFFRSSEGHQAPYEVPFELGDVTVADLARAFERLMARAQPDPVEPPTHRRRSLADQMRLVLGALEERFQSLDRLVTGEFTRTEVVWWFLALLELIRLGQARVRITDGEVEFARGVSR